MHATSRATPRAAIRLLAETCRSNVAAAQAAAFAVPRSDIMTRTHSSQRLSRRDAVRMAVLGGAGLAALRWQPSPAARAQGDNTEFTAALDSFIRGALQTYGVPGAGVAVVSEGR